MSPASPLRSRPAIMLHPLFEFFKKEIAPFRFQVPLPAFYDLKITTNGLDFSL